MGCCFSDEDDETEKYMAAERLKAKDYIKVLLLGGGESGKSTILKQMKIIHMNGYTREELLQFRVIVWRNMTESLGNLVMAIHKFGYEYSIPVNKVSPMIVDKSSLTK
jgi:guanine nucleotide-binding protein subunit alpha